MSTPMLRRLAWAVFAAELGLIIGNVILSVANGTLVASLFLDGPAFAIAGILVLARQPRNAIGWLLLGAGSVTVAFVARNYAQFALLTEPGALPFATAALWIERWSVYPGVAAQFALVQRFPTGRLPSTAWWPVAWGSALLMTLNSVFTAFAPGPIGEVGVRALPNPLGIQEVGDLVGAFRVVAGAGYGLAFVSTIALAVVRFRRARGIERAQLKWFAYAGTVAAVALIAYAPLPRGTLTRDVLNFVYVSGFTLMPIAVLIAITRYRLYDIDILINRTVVYGAVSALLVGTYAAAVVLFQAVLRPFTGGSEVAVATSTLLVVALFNPLRRRVQDLVDHRFYRSRYDAARALDAFTARLRSEVDIESVRADLLGVVGDTIRPAHASVWLRGAKG